MASVVLSGVDGNVDRQGTLFQGIKFWVSQKVPQRLRYIEDVKVYDLFLTRSLLQLTFRWPMVAKLYSLRKTPMHSYTFIEKSIRNGVLENLQNHAVGPGPGAVRSVASVVQPPKTTRQKFTEEDDRVLWRWVNTNPQKGGGTDGNEIYKQLEAKNPRHPWQSWRDRWVKHLKGRPRPVSLPLHAPPTPPSDLQATSDQPEKSQRGSDLNEGGFDSFTEADAQALLEEGESILDIPPENKWDAWSAWADNSDRAGAHSAKQWLEFWEQKVRPRYITRQDKQAKSAAAEQATESVATSTANNGSQTLSTTQNASIKSAETPSAGRETLKRKYATAEEEVPSSSPPHATSPKRRRQHESNIPTEIASTPDRSPSRRDEAYSPLFVSKGPSQENALPEDGIALGQVPSESLSEPDNARQNTQAVFRDTTPPIDFDVPPPEDGWGDEGGAGVESSENNSEYDSARTEISNPQTTLPDTQALLEGRTQPPDLLLPDPDGGWDILLMPSSPPAMPSSPHAESVSSYSDISAQIDAWIESHVTEDLSAERVESILKCTCMDTSLAEQVIEHVRKEGEMPNDWKGVWTQTDDEDLRSTDARKIQRLEQKHGNDCLDARWEFLDFYSTDE